MDLQLFLLVSAASLAAVSLINLAVHRLAVWSWAGANLAVVAIAGLTLYFTPGIAGFLTVAAWLILILAPALLGRLATRRALMNRMPEAARYARLAALFHPGGATLLAARTSTALAQPSISGRVAALQALLPGLTPAAQTSVRLLTLRVEQDWSGILALARAGVPGTDLPVVLRALGESGEAEAMLETFRRSEGAVPATHLPLARLFLLAFGGHVAALNQLLAGRLAPLTAEAKLYWQSVALRAAGREEPGRAGLARIAASTTEEGMRRAAERQLMRPDGAARLSPAARATLNEVAEAVENDTRFRGAGLRQMPATLVLILANIAMFGVEIWAGGSEDADVLLRLGALWPPAITEDGEVWRLLTAQFLHAGVEHILANMVALWFLGRALEYSLGSLRFALVYALGGLGSMAGVYELMRRGLIEENLLVGASGAIFAVFGAIAALRLLQWQRSRRLADRRALISLAAALGLQAAIDLSVPQISFSAHAVGLAAGAILAAGLWLGDRRLR